MKKNSFLIRFIDIGLIILFGFLSISDITVRSQIELPGSEEADQQQQTERKLYVINIDPENYRLSEYESESLLGNYSDIVELESALMTVKSNANATGTTPIILIELHEDIIMQRMVSILDLCDKLQIAKNINEPEFRL